MEGIVALFIPIALFVMIFGIVYLSSREKMAMIERGMDPRAYRGQAAPFRNLKWGLLLLGSGIGLFIAYILDETTFRNSNDTDALYFALIAIFGGIGLLISYRIERKYVDDQDARNNRAD
ncbi:MAG: hypothetical protein INR69_16755 [Mucilaginibacter polytrichastri]|nr:hypothetical protein [Mucilaginibacter polytrichastri]